MQNSTKLQKFKKNLEKKGILSFAKKLPKKAEVYFVGGAIRDALLSRPDSGDYDFVVRGVEAKALEKILTKIGQIDFVGKHFGVFKFTPKNVKLKEALDIALPRTEHSLGTGAYGDFKIRSNPNLKIKDDLSRRDFTMNAIACQMSSAKYHLLKLIDPHGGISDIQTKTIRTVGKAADRFKEDYSRMLRAVRFACQLNFSLEKQTWAAIKKLMPKINSTKKDGEQIVPYEIISSELLKALTSNPAMALKLLGESGALKALMPELLKIKGCPQPKNWHSEGDVWQHTLLCLKLLQARPFSCEFKARPRSPIEQKLDPELVLAVLFHDIGKPYVVETPEKDQVDHIRFHGHEKKGAELTRKICNRLRIMAPPKFNVDCGRIVNLVGKHLLSVNSKNEEMKNTTVEKYFLRDARLGENFMKLFWIDAQASIPEKGKPDISQYKRLKAKIKKVKSLRKKADSRGRVQPIINGDEIMKEFNLKPGKKIGELLDLVREEQLSGKAKTKRRAIKFLKHALR